MKKILLYTASIFLLLGCLDEDAFETPSIAFYPDRLAFAEENDNNSYVVSLRTTGELSGGGQVKVAVTNGEYLSTVPPIENGVITLDFEEGDRDATITVKVLDDDLTESYEAQFMFSSVSGAIKSYTSTSFSLFIENTDVVFAERFNVCDGVSMTPISVKGDEVWSCTPYGVDGSSAYRMNGYNSGPQENEDWLVSSEIDLTSVSSATLEFQSDVAYATTQSVVDLFISEKNNNPSGAIVAGAWTKIAAEYDGDGGNDTWTSSGRIDLKNYLGREIFIAFRYVSTSSSAAQWTIDDVVVEGYDPTYVPGLMSLSENFETVNTSGDLSLSGWINFAEKGEVKWKGKESDGNKYAQIDAASSSDAVNVSWLITPKINFDALSTKTMSFNSEVRFADDAKLELYYSPKLIGNPIPDINTWTKISYTNATEGAGFVSSGEVSLGSAVGEGYIGFRYVGSGASDIVAQYRIDDVKIGVESGSSGDYIFFDDFEGCTDDYATPSNFIEAIVAGAKTDRGWGCRAFGVDGSRAVRASAFGGEPGTDNAWLITANKVNLSSVTTAYLSMDVSSTYDGDGDIKALWSIDYSGSGDPSSATWTELADFAGQLPAKGSGSYSFVVSDLTAATGNQVYIAIQFVGGTDASSSSWDVDNFMVSETMPSGSSGGGGGGGASSTDIATARTMDGKDVVITGVVTTPEFGFSVGNYFIQDNTGGISVTNFDNVKVVDLGDEVEITGTIGSYNGAIQITVTSYSILTTGNALPTPTDITSVDLSVSSSLQGSRIKLSGVTLDDSTQWPTEKIADGGGANVSATVNGVTFEIRIDRDESFYDGSVAPTGSFTITGILSRYNDTVQIMPFIEGDIN